VCPPGTHGHTSVEADRSSQVDTGHTGQGQHESDSHTGPGHCTVDCDCRRESTDTPNNLLQDKQK